MRTKGGTSDEYPASRFCFSFTCTSIYVGKTLVNKTNKGDKGDGVIVLGNQSDISDRGTKDWGPAL